MWPCAAQLPVPQPGSLRSEVGWAGSRAGDRDPAARQGGVKQRVDKFNLPQMDSSISMSQMTQPRHREVTRVAQGHTAG